MGLLDSAAAPAILQLWWFGRLIANTDMHSGNLSFQPRPAGSMGSAGGTGGQAAAGLKTHPLTLAPAYDMLPMAYAPLPGGEVPPAAWAPAWPAPAHRMAWLAASSAAISFWTRAAADSRISEGFRATAAANAQALVALTRLV